MLKICFGLIISIYIFDGFEVRIKIPVSRDNWRATRLRRVPAKTVIPRDRNFHVHQKIMKDTFSCIKHYFVIIFYQILYFITVPFVKIVSCLRHDVIFFCAKASYCLCRNDNILSIFHRFEVRIDISVPRDN